MKNKTKLIISIIVLITTIAISNLGQLFLSNEQFRKEDNNTNLGQ